jgi:hypothetical protein
VRRTDAGIEQLLLLVIDGAFLRVTDGVFLRVTVACGGGGGGGAVGVGGGVGVGSAGIMNLIDISQHCTFCLFSNAETVAKPL